MPNLRQQSVNGFFAFCCTRRRKPRLENDSLANTVHPIHDRFRVGGAGEQFELCDLCIDGRQIGNWPNGLLWVNEVALFETSTR